ncbi:MAG: aspartate aminotransferase family protein [Ignisphaera sp.]|uniref:Aspartate aminotransferase family protein n=1 Tax=Ignisphaera aggregans TaxID=334771 RepID=A0A7C4NLM9_9CREN
MIESSNISKLIDEIAPKFISMYLEKTRKSRELFTRALKVFPGGVTYHIRYVDPYPPYIVKAKSSKVWDVDGNEYDDYWMGHGVHILGHAPDFVVEYVNSISKQGTHLGFENTYALEYAELLTKVIPNAEMIRFCNSGTEANMYALRLARAYTKRKYVIKIEGGWHGSLDQLHVSITPPFVGPESLGIPEEFTKYTIAIPYNDVETIERALKGLEVAAILIEPVPGSGFIEPEHNYLKEVRRLTEAYGSLLIFDEVVTGFRLALGGAQEFFNVDADIVVLGKIIGGGYPGAGAFAGKKEYMELLDHITYPSPRQRVFHGGTFTGNTITMSAGYATIKYLSDNSYFYDRFNSQWSNTAKMLDKACENYDRICWITSTGSMIGIHFTSKKPRSVGEAYITRWNEKIYRVLHLYMLTNNVIYMTASMPHLMPSMIHTEDQANKFVALFEQFLSIIMGRKI